MYSVVRHSDRQFWVGVFCCFAAMIVTVHPFLLSHSRGDDFATVEIKTSLPDSVSVIGNWALENRWRGDVIAESTADSPQPLQVDCDTPMPVELRVGRQRFQIWLAPAQTLAVDLRNPDAAKFSGDLALENQLLIQLHFFQLHPTGPADLSDVETFAKWEREQRDRRLQLLAASQVNEEFRQYCLARIHAAYSLQLQNQPLLNQLANQFDPQTLPKDYFQFWEELPTFGTVSAQRSYRYIQALDAKFEFEARQQLNQETESETGPSALQIIDRQLHIQGLALREHTPELADRLTARKLLFAVDHLSDQAIDKLFSRWQVTNTDWQAFLEQERTANRPIYADLSKMVVQSPDGQNTIADLAPPTPYLIVTWGTWCQACAIEKPKLVQLFNDKKLSLPIVFVNFDDTNEIWQTSIAGAPDWRNDWKPTDPAMERALKQALRMKSFPGYYFVSPEKQTVYRLPSPGTFDFLEDLEKLSQHSEQR